MSLVRTTSLASEGSPRGSVFRSFVRNVRRITGDKSLYRDESGVAAVELALVSPFLILLMIGIVDFGGLFFLQNNMHTAARESARALAVQAVSESEAEQLAQDKLMNWGATFTVVTTTPNPAIPAETDVTVSISVPMADAAPIGLIFDLIGSTGGTLQTQFTMREEG